MNDIEQTMKDVGIPMGIFKQNPLNDVDLTAITRRAADGSYVVTKKGLPFHVPNIEGYKELFEAVDEYAKAHPEVVTVEHPYVPTPEELAVAELDKAKAERATAVAAITVEIDGMVFDGDEKAQERMTRAVILADSPEETTEWVLHDNTVAIVTAEQLRKACKLAGKAQTVLWIKPYTDTVAVNETDTETNTHYTLE
jgi:hypothetical protein